MPQYNDDILNYYHDDTHIGSFDQNEKNIGTGLVGAPHCGDVMKLQIKVGKNNDIEYIEDAKILVFGCGSAKASSSYAAKKIIGMSLEEAKKVKNTDIANALDLPKLKLHCSVLVEDAIKKAINDYKNKQNNNTSSTSKNEIEKTDSNEGNFSLRVDDESIVFTIEQLKQVEKNKKIKTNSIRLSLEEGSCGLIYKVRFIEDKENVDEDIVFIAKTTDETCEIKIFVSNDMKKILNGTHISYKEENLKRGLVFTNPKETGRCNCGKNFYIDKKTKKKNTKCK